MNTDRQILNIEARLKDLRHDLANDLRHDAKQRIELIQNLLFSIYNSIDIKYTVLGPSTTSFISLDNVIGLRRFMPLAFEFNPSTNYNYRWIGMIQEVDQLNNGIFLVSPLPEVPYIGSAVRICGQPIFTNEQGICC